jgi:mono/diheme cytochrome c family protein
MTSFPHRGPLALAVVLFSAAAASALPPGQQTLDLYAQRCQVCHGVNGEAPDPDRNLADGEWLHGNSLAAAIKVITNGVPGKAMVSFKEQLTAQQIADLARLVRTFPPKPAPTAKAAPPAKAGAPAKRKVPASKGAR